MLFSIEVSDLELPKAPLRDYDEEDHDVRSILADICEAVAECGKVSFRVSGFGQLQWPVDVLTDLPVFLEQLPAAILMAQRGDRDFVLDFYEQGVQRSLSFAPRGNFFAVRCHSDTDWIPNPASESITAQDLLDMLRAAKRSFLRVANAVAPQQVGHPWILEWQTEG